MYQFKPYTKRIWNYRQKVRDRVIFGDAEKFVIQAEALQKYKHIVPIIRRPLVTKSLCEKMPIRIEDDDYFVGTKGKHFCGNSGVFWPLAQKIEDIWELRDGVYYNPDGEDQHLAISQEDLDAIRRVAPIIFESSDSAVAEAWLPDGAKEFFELHACDYGRVGQTRHHGLGLRSSHAGLGKNH